MNSDKSPWAPYSWGTADPGLAQAISTRLQAAGIHRELCNVKVAQKEEVQKTNAMWRRSANALLQAMGGARGSVPDQFGDNVNRLCQVCGFTPSLDVKLLQCVRCKRVFYCTKTCQKLDWPMHKTECVPPGTPEQASASTSSAAAAATASASSTASTSSASSANAQPEPSREKIAEDIKYLKDKYGADSIDVKVLR